MDNKIILELVDISKSFPGIKALDHVSFDVKYGEIHALVGENGAGKSTLIKILSGAYLQDEGSIYFEKNKLKNIDPLTVINLGIQTIYQEHKLFPLLTVRENLFLNTEYCKGKIIIDAKKMEKKAYEILNYLQSSISPRSILKNLTSGEQKIVEIARGLIQESKVIILDEPTSSFSKNETKILFDILKRLKDRDISIIYISHHLDEVFKIADRVTVLRDGKKISTYEISSLTEEKLVKDMIGRNLSTFFKRSNYLNQYSNAEVVFEAKNLSGNGVKNASLYVRQGELLGIAGMVGSGRTELAELLFGVKMPLSGEIKIKGEKVNITSPAVAIANKICFITEDRQRTGLFMLHSILQNSVVVNYLKTKSILALPREDIRITKKYIDRLKIACSNIFQKVDSLSGGNQQKVVLTKWFMVNGEYFIFDEPTRGIDVGAKQEIYKLMVEILEQGKSIIMISSDMLELISMSNRINIMKNGEIVAELQEKDISEDNILKYSIGSIKND